MGNTKKILILVLCSYLFSDMHPSNGKQINYTQVFFSWGQIPNVESYIFKIEPAINGQELELDLASNSVLLTEFLDWNTSYLWSICGIYSDNSTPNCSEINTLHVNSLPNYFPSQINITNYDDNLSLDGITVMDFESLNFSASIDYNGYPVWFADKENFQERFVFSQFLNTGNMVGFGPGIGYEIDLDGNILFQTPSGYSVHHDFNKTINNTYFMVTATVENHYCPQECNPNLPDEIPWQGDTFVELDSNGNELWAWNTFDYFDLNEYNPYYVETYSGNYEMDWTHSNSVSFDINSMSVFVSVRNLSRITKIDYNNKDLIWNLGETDFMNEPYFEEDLNFSQQHSVQVLDNGNLLFFDNHRYLEPELSRCLEIEYNESNNSAEIVWEHILPAGLFSGSRGECDRLANGNTLITAGRTGNTLEVTNDNQIVWQAEVENMGIDVTMYRSARIPNLYPLAFSIEINELDGEINNYFIDSNNESLTANIYNHGWEGSVFSYHLENINQINFISGNLEIAPDTNSNFSLNINDLAPDTYKLIVYPNSAPEKQKTIQFNLNSSSVIGDLNNDNSLNILDVVILANIILNNDNSNSLADINQDGLINVLDIVILVNLILEP